MEKILKTYSVALVIVLMLTGCRATKSDVTLINESSSAIQNATIQVNGESFALENIAPLEKKSFSFSVTRDSDYTVKILFSGGREIFKKELGYVTSGVDLQDIIHVKDSDITLETIKREFHK